MKKLIFLLSIFISIRTLGQLDTTEALDIKKDPFTAVRRIGTPFFLKDPIFDFVALGATFFKTIAGQKSTYSLYLSHKENALNVHKTGAYILFTNGKKISKPLLPIRVSAGNDSYYNYSAEFQITGAELILFKENSIKVFRLFRYDEYIDSAKGQAIRIYLKRLMEAQ